MVKLELLEQAIGYNFEDRALLEQALTHSSFRPPRAKGAPIYNNERFEFLGDRILNFCVAEYLFHKFRNYNEGQLAKHHAALVRQDTLAIVARNIGLGEYLYLGRGEESSQGRNKDSILSDAIEALVAAIYMDSDLAHAQAFVKDFVIKLMNRVEVKDPKSALQEWLQSKNQPLPEYVITETKGEAHARVFMVQVQTQAFGSATGEGSSKQSAQQEAARALLKILMEK